MEFSFSQPYGYSLTESVCNSLVTIATNWIPWDFLYKICSPPFLTLTDLYKDQRQEVTGNGHGHHRSSCVSFGWMAAATTWLHPHSFICISSPIHATSWYRFFLDKHPHPPLRPLSYYQLLTRSHGNITKEVFPHGRIYKSLDHVLNTSSVRPCDGSVFNLTWTWTRPYWQLYRKVCCMCAIYIYKSWKETVLLIICTDHVCEV